MNSFTYAYPVKVYFGEGAGEKALSEELKKVGKNILLAYGGGSIKKNGVYDAIKTLLASIGKDVVDFDGIMPNPTYAKVLEGAALVRERKIDFILAVGGGSVIDCCKIISAQAKLDRDIWEMEFVDRQYPSEFIPMGAIVTASGTGAEMNNGAVITNEDKKIKAGLLGSYASFAVLDPAYTMSLPMKQVISGAFDTLSHCMETYFGMPGSGNLSDQINEAVMKSTIVNIRELVNNPENMEARSELMWASAMAENGILKIGKVTDFQAHQIEHQLGAYTDCNHGCGLAVIHPVLYRHIYTEAVGKFEHFATSVWNVQADNKTQDEVALAGIQALEDFIKEIGLPLSFRAMGITDESVLKKVADTCNITAAWCKKLTPEEILNILKECY